MAYMPGLALRWAELSSVAAPAQARHLLVVSGLGDLGATETKTEANRTRAAHRTIMVISVCAGSWRRMRDLNPRGF